MTVSTILALVVGVLIPAATAAVTRTGLDARLKALVLLVLSTVSAAFTTALTSPPHSWPQWQHFLLNLALTLIAAALSLIATWHFGPAQRADARIHAATDPRFGIGPSA